MTRDDIIEKYINDYLLKGLHYGGNRPRMWCIDNEIIIMYGFSFFEMSILYVSEKTWDNLCYMFSLTDKQTNNLFKSWAIRTLGLPENISVLRGFV